MQRMAVRGIISTLSSSNKEMEKRGFTAYILDAWNILDFIVVFASLVDFIVTI